MIWRGQLSCLCLWTPQNLSLWMGLHVFKLSQSMQVRSSPTMFVIPFRVLNVSVDAEVLPMNNEVSGAIQADQYQECRAASECPQTLPCYPAFLSAGHEEGKYIRVNEPVLCHISSLRCIAGRVGKMGLQPVALDMTSGGKRDLAQLLAKLEGSRKKGPGGESGMLPIRGLVGEEAAGKVRRHPYYLKQLCLKELLYMI